MCAKNQKSRWKRGGVTGLVIFEGSVPNCRSYALQPSAVQACAKLYACMCMRVYMYTCKYVNMGETKRARPRESECMSVTHTRWSRVRCLCATSTRPHSAMAHFPRKTTTHLTRGDVRIFTTAFSTRSIYVYIHIHMNMYTYVLMYIFSNVYLHNVNIYMCIYTYICIYTHIHVNMDTYILMYIFSNVYLHNVNIYICIYIYIYVYIHMYM